MNQSRKKRSKLLSANSDALLCAAFQDKILRDLKITKRKKNIHANPRKNLTLAQQIGIEARPPSPLRDSEWEMVRKQSITRNDAKYGCSICCDDFKMKKQVILSCSHTFHYQCLLSFERHSQALCCPLCRNKDYEKSIIDHGLQYWKQRCYLLIQNTWRSYVCVKEYKIMQQTIEPRSPTKRERFYMRKFQNMNYNLISSVHQRCDDIDAFLSSIDDSIAVSRTVFNAVNNPNNDKEEHKEIELTRTGKRWVEIKAVAIERNETDCSICMEQLKEKKCVLLSCSHVFHNDCVQSFERFTLNRISTCPICRQEYEKIVFNS
eukprot:80163_1